MNFSNPAVKKLAGVALILIGGTMSAWLAYNLFIEAQPEFVESTGGRTRSAGKALILFGAMLVCGFAMVFGKSKQDETIDSDQPQQIPPQLHAEVAQLAKTSPIEAIKRFREGTGAGLTEAKAYVDDLRRAA